MAFDTRWTRDITWAQKRALPARAQIAMATFAILCLELALIRWTSSQLRALAYLSNLVLMVAFLGMGLGMALGRRHPGLVHLALPVLLALAIPMGLAQELNLVHMSFPDARVFLWGGETAPPGQAVLHVLLLCGLLGLLLLVFVAAGAPVGHLFGSAPPQSAYSWDLGGSLLGTLVFSVATALHATPPVWLLLGAAPLAWLSGRKVGWVCLAAVVGLGQASVHGAVFSAYNRIDVEQTQQGLRLSVNRDFHQDILDLSNARVEASRRGEVPANVQAIRYVYDMPFVVNPQRQSALVVAAGTGNDVTAALRAGYGRVTSVDIDGRIIDLGRQLHPEHPYDDPRTVAVVNDARAFFEQYNGPPFDAVVYGLLDSHAMFSAMSSLRLDNYVYTEQGIAAAWRHVGPGGHLAISFSVFAGDWIMERMYWTVALATGKKPVVMKHGMNYGNTFLVARDGATLNLAALDAAPLVEPRASLDATYTTSDDWPFLYVRLDVFPWLYVFMLLGLLLVAWWTVPRALGQAGLGQHFHPVLFFMGAAFLLLETRAVTSLALLFGSTWVVNTAVFAGILAMALVSNLVVARVGRVPVVPAFVALLASLLALWWFEPSMLAGSPLLIRGGAGALINALPVGIAGLLVSQQLRTSPDPAAAMASNLVGSMVGGCLEYLSTVTGLRALVLLAMVLYLLAWRGMLRSAPAQ